MPDYYDRDTGDDIQQTTLSTRVHRTRTRRTLQCGHNVPAGTTYRKWVGIIDGEFTSFSGDCILCYAEAVGEPEDVEKLRERMGERSAT